VAPACTFCEIAAGVRAAARVLEDEACIAFLDHRPLFPGHVLLVPRVHCATLPELPARAAPAFLADLQLLCLAVERASDAEGAFLAINHRVSQSVSHLHAHVVPRRRGDGLRGFFWPRRGYDGADHLERVRAATAAVVAALDPARAVRDGERSRPPTPSCPG
jgi:histidine triad (HIT) family protein